MTLRSFGRLPDRTAVQEVTIASGGLTPPIPTTAPRTDEAPVRYAVDEGEVLRMEASAVTDAPTLVNLAQHSYFNLDDSPDILDPRVQIFADPYTPTDADLIPTGEIVSVAGTNFDF